MIGMMIGRYRIIDKLGEGGMGTVYKAEDTTLNRMVALKALSGHLAENAEAKERFLREAQATSALNHNNITTVFDLLEEEGQHFICMEYVEGKTLRDLVTSGRVPVKKAVDIILQTAEALEAAHEEGILHRDIKSANIMVNDKGRVKVMDFGLAHLEERSQITSTGTTMGTLSYSSPEQVSGREVDARSEIFSLGVVFYELLTGQLPFTGASEAETVLAIISSEPRPISEHRGDVSDSLEAVVVRMIRKDPELRYQSCTELISDLQIIKAGLETSTLPMTAALSATRAARRKALVLRVAAGTAVVAAVAVVAWLITADVRRQDADVSASADIRELMAMAEDRPKIAVLPLANLSAQEENSNLAAGLHEELLRRLTLVRSLAVISRTSVLRYSGADRDIPAIAAELGARYIVEGSVQEDAGRVRIQIQVIDASTDQHLWADRFDRERSDIFALQSDVAQAIVDELEVAMTVEEQARIIAPPTQNPIAYDLFVRAQELNRFIRGEHDTKIDLLRRATRLDPGFALAHALLANVFYDANLSYGMVPLDSALARADFAVRLNPDEPQILATKGITLADMGQYEAGRDLLLQALQLDPNNYMAWSFLAAVSWHWGDFVAGALTGRQALVIDPQNPPFLAIGTSLLMAGMYDEAMQWYERALDINPTHSYCLIGLGLASVGAGDSTAVRTNVSRLRETGAELPLQLLHAGVLEIWLGNLEAAASALREAVAIDPNSCLFGSPSAEALLGWTLVKTGQPGARERLQSLHRVRTEQWEPGRTLSTTYANDLAVIASALGEEDEHLRWFLEAARQDRQRYQSAQYIYYRFPFHDRIRNRPEFQAWFEEEEQCKAAQRRELAAMGPWTPEAVLPDIMGESEAVAYDPRDFDALAGRYSSDEDGRIYVFWREGETLYTQGTTPRRYTMVPTSDSTFVLIGIDASVVFHRDPDGRVTGVTIHQNGEHHATRLQH